MPGPTRDRRPGPHRVPRRAGAALALVAVLGLGAGALSACSGSGADASASAGPTWTPVDQFPGDGGGLPTAPGGSGPSPSPSSPSGSTVPTNPNATDPDVMATKLAAPTAIAVRPDGTALVGERAGRILLVQDRAGQPVKTVRTLTGLDTGGDGGLLDLALSPQYPQDGLIYAYITTPHDNRVVEFTLTGPVTSVLTGIPRGAVHNSGRLLFGPDGTLYVATSDAGRAAAATDPSSLAGKILHVSDVGAPTSDDRSATSPVYATGGHLLTGLCLDASSGAIFAVDAAGGGTATHPAGTVDRVHRGSALSAAPVALPAKDTSPGGCATLSGSLFVTSLDGTALLQSVVNTTSSGAVTLGPWQTGLVGTYGRLRTVAADPGNGALWLSTSNRDGHGRPVAADERIVRVTPSGGGGSAGSSAAANDA